MTNNQIKKKALAILSQPRPTIEQWLWFKRTVQMFENTSEEYPQWIKQKLD